MGGFRGCSTPSVPAPTWNLAAGQAQSPGQSTALPRGATTEVSWDPKVTPSLLALVAKG